ncbi:MAG TPA: hypothetical protein DFS52_24155 [Myxococcales bacterium]|jgi:hypothetical protein|nr:hypothetical protein [Myxococcales bacterium]
MSRLTLAAVAAIAIAAVGCGPGGKPGGAEEGALSSISINLVTNPNFQGNSVRIVGTRVPGADLKYPCLNSIDTCWALDVNGSLFHVIEDLCPSENIPKGDWTFTYEIYSELDCKGELMNAPGNPNNFVCYAIDDIFDQAHANYSVEKLEAGVCNENEIVCITKTADKTFDFDVCVEVDDPCKANPPPAHCPQPPPTDNDILRLDCGCVDVSGVCNCAQGLDGLPSECTVLPANGCLVVCGEPAKVAAARFRSFDANSAVGDDIFLGIGDVGVGSNRVQTGFQWAPTSSAIYSYPVSFVYTPGLGAKLVANVGAASVKTLEYSLTGDLGSMDSFKVTIAARGPDPSKDCDKVELLNLTLDGVNFGNFTATSGEVADYDFSTALLNGGFTFTGTLVLTNCAATQENSKVEILVGRNTAALF